MARSEVWNKFLYETRNLTKSLVVEMVCLYCVPGISGPFFLYVLACNLYKLRGEFMDMCYGGKWHWDSLSGEAFYVSGYERGPICVKFGFNTLFYVSSSLMLMYGFTDYSSLGISAFFGVSAGFAHVMVNFSWVALVAGLPIIIVLPLVMMSMSFIYKKLTSRHSVEPVVTLSPEDDRKDSACGRELGLDVPDASFFSSLEEDLTRGHECDRVYSASYRERGTSDTDSAVVGLLPVWRAGASSSSNSDLSVDDEEDYDDDPSCRLTVMR